MLKSGEAVKKYQIGATIKNGVIEWTFALQTEDGGQHVFPIRDAEEIPTLLDMCRRDTTIYFDAMTGTIRSGWNSPGHDERVRS